ncbi:MAG: AI-2E family transporter [Firmicutes bacterium]|nr:AI-2E family transporter [Bacillota bacterium]
MRPLNKYEKNWTYIIGIALLALIVINFKSVIRVFGWIWGSFSLVIYSFALAYILNIIMVRIDSLFDWFKESFIHKYRRVISLLVTLIIVLVFMYLLIDLVVPQVINALAVIVQEIPIAYRALMRYVIRLFENNPDFQEYLLNADINWGEVFKTIASVLTVGIGSVFNVTFSVFGGVFSVLMDFVIVFILAIYILIDKERFFTMFYRLCNIYLEDKTIDKLNHKIAIVDATFANFFIGKVVEAIVLGGMIAGGMILLKLPYPVMVGTLVGVINMLPMIGAYIGGAIGAFMVFTVDPIQAIIFLVYLCLIQQIEANLIYPKIAGNSIGLPGVYVLMSVVVCGSLGGILGMILGIPIVGSIYKIVREYLDEKEREKLENFKL